MAVSVVAAGLLFLVGFSAPWIFGDNKVAEEADDEPDDPAATAVASTSGSVDGAAWTWTLEDDGTSACTSVMVDGTESIRTCKPAEDVLLSAGALAYLSPPLPVQVSEGEGDTPLRHVLFLGYERGAVELAPGVAGRIEEVIVENRDRCADCTYVFTVWVGPAEGPARFRVGPDGAIVSPFGMDLRTFDPDSLAAMAADGFIVDDITLPANITWFGREANGSQILYRFGDVETSMGVDIVSRPGGQRRLRREATEFGGELKEQALEDGTELFLTELRGEIRRVSRVIDGRLVEVGSDRIGTDLVKIMSDLVWLGPVDARAANPTLEEARAALDGLSLSEALRVATEAGWRIRPANVNGESQPLDSNEQLNRVNVSITEDYGVTVLDVG